MTRQETAIAKYKAITKKKRERYEQRAKDKKQADNLNRAKSVTPPEGITVIPLDSPACDHLRLFTQGYTGAKGNLLSLFRGTDMKTAIETTRNDWFSSRTPEWIIANLRSIALKDWQMGAREEEFHRKVGPFYLRPFSDWAPKAFEVFTPMAEHLDREDLVKQCLLRIRDEYRYSFDEPLEALHPIDTQEKLNKKASTGWPFFTSSKWDSEVEYPTGSGKMVTPFEWYLEKATEAVNTDDYSCLDDATFIMFTRKMYRGMVDKEDLKMSERTVQCSSALERMIGSGVQQPLLQVQRDHPYSEGHNGVWAMGHSIQRYFDTYEHAFEADYSGFDSTLRADVMDWIFELVIIPLFHERHHNRIRALRNHYRTGKLWTPVGVITSDRVGLLSGSILTNAVGMIYGQMAWYYFLARLEEEGTVLNASAIGYSDDLAAFFDCPSTWESPRQIISEFSRITSELGLVAHPEKQGVWSGDTKQVSFLGCIFFDHIRRPEVGCLPTYPIMRMASKLIWNEHFAGANAEPEKFVIRYSQVNLGYHEKLIAAMLGRLDVARYHESFYHLCEFVYKETGISEKACLRIVTPAASPSLAIFVRLAEKGVECTKDRIVEKVEEAIDEFLDDPEAMELFAIELERQAAEEKAMRAVHFPACVLKDRPDNWEKWYDGATGRWTWSN